MKNGKMALVLCVCIALAASIYFGVTRGDRGTQNGNNAHSQVGEEKMGQEREGRLSLRSNAFEHEGVIPQKYSCDGENISPDLSWDLADAGGKSSEVKSYVLIVDDLDAQKVVGRTVIHWAVILSGSTARLPEGISGARGSKLNAVDAHAVELSDNGKTAYRGPCPPQGGGEHRYDFTLFATNQPVEAVSARLSSKAGTAQEVERALADTILARALLVGRYTRK